MSELARRDSATPDVLADLQHFEAVVLEQLEMVGLPGDDVFVDVGERQKMLMNVPGVLALLDSEILGRSHYISKMIAAASVGLFDAALNYLWDELVTELRRRVKGFDLAYFYDIAAGTSDLRKHLNSEQDLVKVLDADLLRAAREIGLLSEVGFQRLDHIRYMRNFASAAHPNQVQLTGLDLAQWLDVCVRHVITTPPDHVTAATGKLLANLKKERLENAAVTRAAAFFEELPGDRADTLANGLFGLYTDPRRTPIVADNVHRLWPLLWDYVSEDTRQSYGVRYARSVAIADTGPAEAARELIDLVDGGSYLPESLRVVELDEALDTLIAAHRGYNNFYNEGAPARAVAALVGENGDVPEEVERKYIRTLVELFLGNGYGVSFTAEQTYRGLLERVDSRQARRALRLFTDEAISSLLSTTSARKQWQEFLDIIEHKLNRKSDRDLFDAIRSFNGTADQLRSDTRIRELANPKVTLKRPRRDTP